jgi:hypothetical protein
MISGENDSHRRSLHLLLEVHLQEFPMHLMQFHLQEFPMQCLPSKVHRQLHRKPYR